MAFALNPYSALNTYGPRTPNLVGVAGTPKYPIQRVGPNGMAVPTDPAALAGVGHPPWLDSLYPKSPQSPGTSQYHTYTPDKGGWKLPPGTHLTWVQGKGYTAAPGTQKMPAAPKDPWTTLLTRLMGSYETPAQQEARVNREVDAQIAANKKMLDDEYQRQMRNAQGMAMGMSAAGQAAAAMSKDLFGQVGGEFNAAAGEIKGLSHGLTGQVGKQTGKDVAASNAELARTGAPELGAGGGGLFAPGGTLQAGVEDYRSGILPGQMFGTQGEAANFGLAGQISSENMKATEEAKAGLMQATRDANDAQNKAIQALAAGRGDLYHQYMSDAQDAQIKKITLAQGIQAAQQATDTKPITRMVGGNLMQWNPVSHTWVRAVKGNTAAIAAAKLKQKQTADAAKAKQPDSALSKIYGHVVDHNGNAILGADGKPQPIAKSASAAAVNVDVQLSRATGVWRDSAGKPIPSLNAAGQPKPPPFFKPSTGKKSGTDKVTKEDMQQAGDEIRDYSLYQRALDKLKKWNDAAHARAKAKGTTFNPIAPDEISSAPANVIAALGLTDAELKQIKDPRTLQEVYISLAHALGGRRAWDLIRKTYPKFGQGYYR